VFSERDERNIVRLIVSVKHDTAANVHREVKATKNLEVGYDSIIRVLKRNELCARVKRKKPLLRQRHRQCRLMFARKYKHWTVKDWERVIWSDEG
jgi:transposase